ncbi:MAG: hypothetical protein QXH19_03635 [Candidatus Bathyarchaeia archaeon]
MLEDLEEEIFDDFEEVPFFDELAEKWKEENKGKIFLNVIPSHAQPQKIEFERVKVEGEEKRKILNYLVNEITKRMDENCGYNIEKVEEAVVFKLLGEKISKKRLIEDFEKYLKFF